MVADQHGSPGGMAQALQLLNESGGVVGGIFIATAKALGRIDHDEFQVGDA